MGSESGEGGSCGTLGEDLQSEMEVTPTACLGSRRMESMWGMGVVYF
jgi:hypothetical protein